MSPEPETRNSQQASKMNEKQVFLVSELGEEYLGTVGEVLGIDYGSESGAGISASAAISDIIGALASDVLSGNSVTITLELRG